METSCAWIHNSQSYTTVHGSDLTSVITLMRCPLCYTFDERVHFRLVSSLKDIFAVVTSLPTKTTIQVTLPVTGGNAKPMCCGMLNSISTSFVRPLYCLLITLLLNFILVNDIKTIPFLKSYPQKKDNIRQLT